MKIWTAALVALALLCTPALATTIQLGETNKPGIADNGNANLLAAQGPYALTQAATIQSLSFYVTTAGGQLRLGLFTSGPNNDCRSGSLKAQTNAFTPVANSWNTANVVTQVSVPTGNYCLAYLPSSNSLGFLKGITQGSGQVSYSFTFGSMPSTYSANPPQSSNYHWGLYATLATSGGGVASVDLSNLDPNDSKLHAPATVNSAEVTRMWVTMNPFYPVASSVTWSLSGTNSGGFALASTTGFPGQLLTSPTGTPAGSYADTTITANVGGQVLSITPTIVVHAGTKAACGSGSTISSAITTAGAGGVVILDACTYTGQTFTALNNQRIQGSGVGATLLDGTGVTTALTDHGPTGVTIDSVGIKGYANTSYTNCDTGGTDSYVIHTDDGWTVENSKIDASGCDAIISNWGTGTTHVLNNLMLNPQRNGATCFPNENTGTFVFQGNEINGANQGNYSGSGGGTPGVAAGIKCFSGSNSADSTVNVLDNYIHDSFLATDQGDGSSGIWFDTIHNSTKTNSIQGNTILNNGRSGISHEVSCNTDISHNFIKGNTGDPNVQFSGSRGIMLRQSGPVNVHDNNISVPASGASYAALEFEPATRSDSCSEGVNVKMYSNSITFFDTSTFAGFPVGYGNVLFDSSSEAGMSICSGTTACGGPNNFHDLNGTGTVRYVWYVSPGNSPAWNFTNYKANSGQDINSTLDTTDGTTGITGCLHIACTGAGL